MPRPAFSEASPSATRRGWQRLAVLAAAAVTAAGALVAIAIAVPATATPAASVSHVTMQDCGGGWIGSGNRTCVASTQAMMPDPPMPCGPLSTYCPAPAAALALTTNAFTQNCGGGWIGSGNRTCVEPAATTVQATAAPMQDCGGGTSTSGGRTCVTSRAALPGATFTT